MDILKAAGLLDSGLDMEALRHYVMSQAFIPPRWPAGLKPVGHFQVVNRTPLVAYCVWHPSFEGFPGRIPGEPAAVLFTLWWPVDIAIVANWTHQYLRRHPCDFVAFLCNSQDEVDSFRSHGIRAELSHYHALLDENFFTIKEEVTQDFKAVLNANTAPWKRHHLATAISDWGWISYPHMGRDDEETANFERISQLPGCRPIGAFRMNPRETVLNINSGRVGLSLSSVDGATYSCFEFLLCGLPLVYTASHGRDTILPAEFCLEVQPEKFQVAAAVEAFSERGGDRTIVRAAAIKAQLPHRRTFFDVLEEAHDYFRIKRPARVITENRMLSCRSVQEFWKN